MAKLFIYKIGGGIDVDELTAKPSDVRASKTFIGQGSEEKQTGSIVERNSPTLALPINGTVTIPEGYYTGGKVTQDIPTLGKQTVNPGKNAVTVNTSGKYMTGDIVVGPIKNLTPSVIKKGEYVANVGPGTYEGYINDDPYTPYYYGTFGPGYTITGLKYKVLTNQGDISLNKDSIELDNDIIFEENSRSTSTAIVFNKPIDLSKVSKLSITVKAYNSNDRTSSMRIVIAQNRIDTAVDTGTGVVPEQNEKLGNVYLWKGQTVDIGEYTIDLTGINATAAYLYICNMTMYTTMYVNAVKFT